MLKYQLKYPIKWDDKEVIEVEIRRPKGKHLKKLGGNMNMNSIMGIAANVSDYTPAFFDELDGADYIGVSEVIGDFLGDGQETG